MATVVPELVGAHIGERPGVETMGDDPMEETVFVHAEAENHGSHLKTPMTIHLNILMFIVSVFSAGAAVIGWYTAYSQGYELDKTKKELMLSTNDISRLVSSLNKKEVMEQMFIQNVIRWESQLARIKNVIVGWHTEPDRSKMEPTSIKTSVTSRDHELELTKSELLSIEMQLTRTKQMFIYGNDHVLPDCSRNPCSQNSQDRWVLRQFPPEYRGFFLDIGAHDGIIISNTLLLEQRGWNGLCIEPIPTNFKHRKCELIRAVVSNVANKMVQFNDCTQFGTDGGDGGLSGISSVYSGHVGRATRCKDEIFTTTTMHDVLANGRSLHRRMEVPFIVDFTSLDVEGAELLVLEAFPFEMYCSRYWVIEHNRVTSQQQEVRKFMQGKSCSVVDNGPLADDFFKCSCRS